jgi:hypothetical protein
VHSRLCCSVGGYSIHLIVVDTRHVISHIIAQSIFGSPLYPDAKDESRLAINDDAYDRVYLYLSVVALSALAPLRNATAHGLEIGKVEGKFRPAPSHRRSSIAICLRH